MFESFILALLPVTAVKKAKVPIRYPDPVTLLCTLVLKAEESVTSQTIREVAEITCGAYLSSKRRGTLGRQGKCPREQ